MLAYVFWHWPGSTVAHEAYADLPMTFHRALAQYPPAVYRCGPAG